MYSTLDNGFNAFYTSVVEEINTTLERRDLLSNDVEMCLKALARFPTHHVASKPKCKRVFRMSGYHLYVSESARQMKLENPTMNPKDITSVVSKGWRTLTDEQKSEYKTRALEHSKAGACAGTV